MRYGSYQGLKRYAVLIAVALTITAFQACEKKSQPQKEQSSSTSASFQSGNGGIYDGKVYVNLNPSCADGIATKIKVESERVSFIVRQNCEDIAPIAVATSETGLMAHNLANLIYDGRAFDSISFMTNPTVWICRGQEQKAYLEGTFTSIIDGLVRESVGADGEKTLFGQVKFGFYDSSGAILESHESQYLNVTKIPSSARIPSSLSLLTFVGESSDQTEMMYLSFDSASPGSNGRLRYVFPSKFLNPAPLPRAQQTPDPNGQPPLVSIKEMHGFVVAVKCYRP